MAGLTTGTETKPGVATTEFWTMLFTNIAGVIQLLTGPVDVQNRYVAIGLAIVNGLYAVGRGFAKQGVAALAVELSDKGAEFIANFEGFRADPYWDVDHYSIGYGTRARGQDDHVTRAEALKRLHDHVEGHVGPAVRELHPFGQFQFDALSSFAYNLGAGVLDGQVGRAVKQGDYRLAGDEMLNYTRAGGEVLPGLVTRREAERRMLMKIRYSDDERYLLGVLRDTTASKTRRARAAATLREQATRIQAVARREDDWEKRDRGRRFQGIRRALKKYAGG